MPKDRRSSSLDRCRASPYSRNYKDDRKTRPRTPCLPVGNENEWEETRCPICMEHPHNAVLLLCSSREKGCLPYMCSTSSRHSNCLDQFRKSSMNANTLQEVNGGGETKLVCPLCRGQIKGWIVVKPARQFMDSKVRSCSLGTCDFSGNYSQLRKHARCEHPNVRPTDVDPERQIEWRSLEEDLVQQDLRSMQFEYVDDDDDDYANEESMGGDGVPGLNLQIGWDQDFISSLFLLHTDSFFSEVDIAADNTLYLDDNPFSEFDIAADDTLYLDDNLFTEFDHASGPARAHNRLPVSSRENGLDYSYSSLLARLRENGPTYTHNRFPERSREYGLTYTHNRFPERSREYGRIDTNNGLSERPRVYGQTNTHSMQSERPRRSGPPNAHNRLSEGRRGYGLTTRSRSNTHRRRGSNSQPSSRNANREEQLSTIVEFHDLSSNRR